MQFPHWSQQEPGPLLSVPPEQTTNNLPEVPKEAGHIRERSGPRAQGNTLGYKSKLCQIASDYPLKAPGHEARFLKPLTQQETCLATWLKEE